MFSLARYFKGLPQEPERPNWCGTTFGVPQPGDKLFVYVQERPRITTADIKPGAVLRRTYRNSRGTYEETVTVLSRPFEVQEYWGRTANPGSLKFRCKYHHDVYMQGSGQVDPHRASHEAYVSTFVRYATTCEVLEPGRDLV